MKPLQLDLIGDIHGHYDKLIALLQTLGYEPQGHAFRHPEGRCVVFLGDYIDRGPKIRETLHLVRNMVDAGDALAIMGNHEFNALCFATPDGNGDFLRKHKENTVRAHGVTLRQFDAFPGEWNDWLEWMKRLPVYLDLGELRAVHACWDEAGILALQGRDFTDVAFLREVNRHRTPEMKAINHLLKGPEMRLPEGVKFTDKEHHEHDYVRVRWWNHQAEQTIGELTMPVPMNLPLPIKAKYLNHVPVYPETARPVFFGHYWMPPHAPKAPLAENLACLDYSGAMAQNPLTAYRWNGPAQLSPDGFVTVNQPKG
jgi:hypothetical protein